MDSPKGPSPQNKKRRGLIWAALGLIATATPTVWLLVERGHTLTGFLSEVYSLVSDSFAKVTFQPPNEISGAYDPNNKTLTFSLDITFQNPHSGVESLKATGGFFGIEGDEAGSAKIDSDSIVFKDGDRDIGSTTSLNGKSGSHLTTLVILKLGTTLMQVIENRTTSRDVVLTFDVGREKLEPHFTFDVPQNVRAELLQAIHETKRPKSYSFSIILKLLKP